MISLIVAVSSNNVIGQDGRLPWYLPADLKRFKHLTMAKPIVMGRLTHESIGKPLSGRQNIVISRQPHYKAEGCTVVSSPEAAIAAAGTVDEIMVIGGGEIYRAFLPLADRIYLTRIDTDIEGDAHFPELDPGDWRESAREEGPAHASSDFNYTYVTLERVG